MKDIYKEVKDKSHKVADDIIPMFEALTKEQKEILIEKFDKKLCKETIVLLQCLLTLLTKKKVITIEEMRKETTKHTKMTKDFARERLEKDDKSI